MARIWMTKRQRAAAAQLDQRRMAELTRVVGGLVITNDGVLRVSKNDISLAEGMQLKVYDTGFFLEFRLQDTDGTLYDPKEIGNGNESK